MKSCDGCKMKTEALGICALCERALCQDCFGCGIGDVCEDCYIALKQEYFDCEWGDQAGRSA